MAELYESAIHKFLKERGGSASKKEIYKALGVDEESKRKIDERLSLMERFGLVVIDGDKVTINGER